MGRICRLTLIITFLLIMQSVLYAITYQIPPTGLPAGLPAQINGKYRIIEHDRKGKTWIAYDVRSWKKFTDSTYSEESIMMYPPIHYYLFLEGNKWDYEAVNKPIETTFRNELVTVIEKGKALKMPLSDGKPLTRNEAQKIVMKAFNPYNKQLWSFASADYRGGVLVCAFSKHLPNGIGIWWAKGNKVFNVNGIARGKTKKFELTFDKNIDVPEAFDTCNTLR